MTRRSFVVFDSSDDAAADCLRLLGRVVLDPRRPLDNYRPSIRHSTTISKEGTTPGLVSTDTSTPDCNDDTNISPHKTAVQRSIKPSKQPISASYDNSDPFLSEFRLQTVVDKKTTIRAKLVRSTKAHLAFTSWFSASRNAGRSSRRTLRATSIQTFALEQHEDVYNAVLAQYGADLEELMQRQAEGLPLYMMVTLKTATGLRVLSADEEHHETAIKTKVPIGEAAAAGGAPPGAGTVLLGSVGAGIKQTKTRKEALQLVAADERAIAAEFCKLNRLPRSNSC